MDCVLDDTSMFQVLWFSNPGISGKEETQLVFLRTPRTLVETRFDCLKLAYGSEIHSRGSYVCLVCVQPCKSVFGVKLIKVILIEQVELIRMINTCGC